MKIGITCYPSVGGSGVIATELGKLLADSGHEIHFITSSLPFRLDKIHPKIFFHQVEVNHYPVFQYPPYDLSLASKMAEIIDQEKLDILHVHYAIPHAICAILARDIADHKVKVVTTLHGTDITVLGIDDTFKKMINYGIEKSDAVTSVSQSLAMQTKEMMQTEKEISVIYNFVDEKEYYPKSNDNLRKQYNITDDEKVVIHISNFRKVKRVQDVIHTFKKVNQSTNSKLLLIGDGPEYSTMKKLVQKLDIVKDVLFLGKQNNISEIISMADIMLLLSEKESFGLVLLEGMACGVPSVATNIGGIPEVIDHGETGYMVDMGDTEQAATYILELFNNPEKLNQFSNNALKRVEHHFHSDKIVQEYIDLYKQILV
ncbi:N-acetyl-alpha-D-glucosaminyl L-malate synthase BshA [Oceanobacillus sp. CAU 1775]